MPSALCPGYSDSGPTRRGSRHGEPYLRHCRSSRLTEHYWQVHVRSTVTFGFDRVQKHSGAAGDGLQQELLHVRKLDLESSRPSQRRRRVPARLAGAEEQFPGNGQPNSGHGQIRSLQQKTTIGVYHPNEPVRVLHGCSGTKRTRGLSVSMACFLAPIVGSPIAFQAYCYLAAEREVAKNILLELHARSVRGGVS